MSFNFESDPDKVATFAQELLGDQVDNEGGEQWKVVINPEGLDALCGTVIVTDQQYFVVDREPTDDRTTFREVYVGPGSGDSTREVLGVSGRTHLGEDWAEEIKGMGNVVIQTAGKKFGGQVFW